MLLPDLDNARLTTLTNGDSVPLRAAAAAYALLDSHLGDPDQEWDVLYNLREVCLGRTIEREPAACLVRNKLLLPDGTVPPVLRSVVLSAVRGQDRVLHLDSPFTSATDHKIANYLTAGDFLAYEGLDDREPLPEHLRDATAFLKRILKREEPDGPQTNGPTGR